MTLIIELRRLVHVYGAIPGLSFNDAIGVSQTTYHSRHSSTKQLTNVTILIVFFLMCVFVTGCQSGCPKCGKYPDSRLRTDGSDGRGGGGVNGANPATKLDSVELKAFKRSFLNKLGLKRPPSRAQVARANVSTDVLHNMKRVYELSIVENNRSHELFPELDTKQFFSFAGTGVGLDIPSQTGDIRADTVKLIFGNFSLPRKRRDRIRVHSAKLQLYFKNADLLRNDILDERSEDRGRAEIYQIVQEPSRHGDDTPNQIRQLLDVRPVSFSRAGWVSFDIKEAVQRWEQDKDAPIASGIEILLSRPELREALVLDVDADLPNFENEDNTLREHSSRTLHPRLDVTVREKPHRRSRRAVRPHPTRQGTDCTPGETTCCRYQRTVSFADLDWDYWIQSPSEYNAYYCDGTCPQGHRMASTYALIKSQMHIVDPSQWNAPCCTASRLGSLPIMHYDHTSPDRYTITIMDDWVVEECMCM